MAVSAEPNPAVDAAEWLSKNGQKRRQPSSSFGDGDGADVFGGDRFIHYRYNRSLTCMSNALTDITFSPDGRWLVTGTGHGDWKVWDTTSWASVAALKGGHREEPRSTLVSPMQEWLVCLQASALCVFHCRPPFAQAEVLPSRLCPSSGEASEWCCADFAPSHHDGADAATTRGQDTHLAVLSTTHLSILDYCLGWGAEMPQRTHSILRFARPTGVRYTACCRWLVSTYVSGQMHIWDARSLTLEQKLSAHPDVVNCLAVSPRRAEYACRLVTVGQDHTIRVWDSTSWAMEQLVYEKQGDDVGIHHCAFSRQGSWLMSVARALCLWRVCLSSTGFLELHLHQRLEAIASVEGLFCAAFGGLKDTIVSGSRDGVLGVWARCPGLPPEPPRPSALPVGVIVANEDTTAASPAAPAAAPAQHDRLPRPMRRVCAVALDDAVVKPRPGSPGRQRGGLGVRGHAWTVTSGPDSWKEKWQLRCSTTVLPSMTGRHPMAAGAGAIGITSNASVASTAAQSSTAPISSTSAGSTAVSTTPADSGRSGVSGSSSGAAVGGAGEESACSKASHQAAEGASADASLPATGAAPRRPGAPEARPEARPASQGGLKEAPLSLVRPPSQPATPVSPARNSLVGMGPPAGADIVVGHSLRRSGSNPMGVPRAASASSSSAPVGPQPPPPLTGNSPPPSPAPRARSSAPGVAKAPGWQEPPGLPRDDADTHSSSGTGRNRTGTASRNSMPSAVVSGKVPEVKRWKVKPFAFDRDLVMTMPPRQCRQTASEVALHGRAQFANTLTVRKTGIQGERRAERSL